MFRQGMNTDKEIWATGMGSSEYPRSSGFIRG
jgi:hypothetical protein